MRIPEHVQAMWLAYSTVAGGVEYGRFYEASFSRGCAQSGNTFSASVVAPCEQLRVVFLRSARQVLATTRMP